MCELRTFRAAVVVFPFEGCVSVVPIVIVTTDTAATARGGKTLLLVLILDHWQGQVAVIVDKGQR